jgi:hypothetical protein
VSEVDNTPEQRIAQLNAIGELPLDERVSRLIDVEAALRDELGRSTADDPATS